MVSSQPIHHPVRAALQAKSLVILLLLALCVPCPAFAAWTLSVEGGQVWSGYNDVQIPNDAEGSRFSLADDLGISSRAYVRVRLSRALSDRSTVSLLAAPLSLDISGASDRTIRFAGETFAAGTPLTGHYRFDSYRVTYRYDDHLSDRLAVGYGVTAKLRDASIELAEDGRTAVKDNVGFVPLLNLRIRWFFAGRLGILLDADALAAPQGRAEDVLLAIIHEPTDQFQMQLGYRVLEGGADVDEVYTFALLHYAVVGLAISF